MTAKEARNKILGIVNQRSLHSIYKESDEAMWIMQVLEEYHQAKSKEEAEERYAGRRVFIEVFNGEAGIDPDERIFNALHQGDDIIWLVMKEDFKRVRIASGKEES